MKNFEFLFAAWMLVWAIFFGYEITVARRLAQVRYEIESLRRQLAGR
jgi:hypothetical protein